MSPITLWLCGAFVGLIMMVPHLFVKNQKPITTWIAIIGLHLFPGCLSGLIGKHHLQLAILFYSISYIVLFLNYVLLDNYLRARRKMKEEEKIHIHLPE